MSVIPLHIPPLRERKLAIIPLIDHFLKMTVKATGKEKVIAPEVYENLMTYPFYGNVRELRNLVERIVILSDDTVIKIEDLPASVKIRGHGLHSGKLIESVTLREALEKFEEDMIREALSACGTFSKAARALGVNQSTISRKAKKYNMTRH